MKTLTRWLSFVSVAVSLVICGCGEDKPAASDGAPAKKSDSQEKRDRSNAEKVKQARGDVDGTQ